jgi:heat-inducible transcriptional repressor
MPDARVTPRERLVLTAIIERYIATGEPVASQAVARAFPHQEGLSSATIRNVMATLGEMGLLEQPHTSAGRVPTAAAFRFYVEQITQPGQMTALPPGAQAPLPMSAERRGQIEESFSGVTSTHDYLERTSHVLALLSSGLGVALASSTASQVLEHIHFSRLSAGRVLAVLVTEAGAVQDRVLVLDRELTHLELETAARYLNENFRGWPVERIRAEVARRVEQEQAAYHQMLSSIEELCRKGALAAGESGPAIFVDGMANLIAAEADRERLRQMLLAHRIRRRTPAGGARRCGPGPHGRERTLARHAGSCSDRRTSPAGRLQPGYGGRDCAHAHPISGDDPGGALYCAPLRAPAGASLRRGSAPISEQKATALLRSMSVK